jgi:VanZ family protein
VAAVALGIFLLSSRSLGSLGSLPHGMDKLAHLTVYGVLGALIARACWRTGSRSSARVVVLSVLLAASYGLSDEIHQRFVPGRQFELADLLADAVGSLLGALLMARARSLRSRGRT